MNNFCVITNSIKDPDYAFTNEVCSFITSHGGIYTDSADDRTQCILVLGGDGTVLQAAGTYLERGIPLLGINLGTLGYLAEIEKNAWKEALLRVFSDNFEIENRMMLEGLGPDGRIRYALNDVVISRNGPPQILGFDVFVNGQFLNTFSADGILLSTPTGSTAYNLSAGGPIVEPSARLILLTPVCPHTLNNRSIVLSPEDEVRIGVGHPSRSLEIEAGAVFDGGEFVQLSAGERITIRESKKTVRLVKMGRKSFLETLHRKMQG